MFWESPRNFSIIFSIFEFLKYLLIFWGALEGEAGLSYVTITSRDIRHRGDSGVCAGSARHPGGQRQAGDRVMGWSVTD
jgi:hypothetical protein